ncbi:hypothetical protein E2C01_014578 [Portunus trituberculatus]|uniref:Uncharacterized protein n=1 Tax=Portunus trituberculatus TaxID=210409 RepID=A0A5B7DKJ8_PORTR|nr:hypothetical protein [Portunus trituberculatus]
MAGTVSWLSAVLHATKQRIHAFPTEPSVLITSSSSENATSPTGQLGLARIPTRAALTNYATQPPPLWNEIKGPSLSGIETIHTSYTSASHTPQVTSRSYLLPGLLKYTAPMKYYNVEASAAQDKLQHYHNVQSTLF